MKIIFNKQSLINTLNISLKAISSRTTEEILNCIHIRAYNEIYFTTSDMELWIKTKVEGQVIKEGELAVNAKLFSDIIKKLPNDEVLFEVIDKQVIISSGISKFKISYINLNGYTDIPEIDEQFHMNVDSFSFKDMIKKTIFCISQSENSGYVMNGEFLEISNNTMKLTAMDGSRIGISKKILENSYEDKSCIIPGKTLNEISKILPSETSQIIDIYITDNHIMFKFDETIILSRLLSGNYINIKKMLSTDYEMKIRINKNDFVDTVDRAMLLIRDSNIQPLIIDISDDMKLRLKSNLGEMNESISIEKFDDNEIKIGVNPKFLLESLRVIEDEDISIYCINRIAPIFIKDDEENYIYILLPVNFIEEE